MSAFQSHKDIWLIQCAVDEFYELPPEATEEYKIRAMRYAFACCYLMMKGLEKHAGVSMGVRSEEIERKPIVKEQIRTNSWRMLQDRAVGDKK